MDKTQFLDLGTGELDILDHMTRWEERKLSSRQVLPFWYHCNPESFPFQDAFKNFSSQLLLSTCLDVTSFFPDQYQAWADSVKSSPYYFVLLPSSQCLSMFLCPRRASRSSSVTPFAMPWHMTAWSSQLASLCDISFSNNFLEITVSDLIVIKLHCF